MSVPDSPVRGMVPMRDYLALVRERDALREEVAYLKGRDRPILLAHQVAGSDSERTQRRVRGIGGEPRAGTRAALFLAALRQSTAPLGIADIARIAGMDARKAAGCTHDLSTRGLIVRVDGGEGKGTRALWRAAPVSPAKE